MRSTRKRAASSAGSAAVGDKGEQGSTSQAARKVYRAGNGRSKSEDATAVLTDEESVISTRSTKNNAAVLSPDTTSLVQICSGQQVDLTSCESDLPDVPLKSLVEDLDNNLMPVDFASQNRLYSARHTSLPSATGSLLSNTASTVAKSDLFENLVMVKSLTHADNHTEPASTTSTAPTIQNGCSYSPANLLDVQRPINYISAGFHHECSKIETVEDSEENGFLQREDQNKGSEENQDQKMQRIKFREIESVDEVKKEGKVDESKKKSRRLGSQEDNDADNEEVEIVDGGEEEESRSIKALIIERCEEKNGKTEDTELTGEDGIMRRGVPFQNNEKISCQKPKECKMKFEKCDASNLKMSGAVFKPENAESEQSSHPTNTKLPEVKNDFRDTNESYIHSEKEQELPSDQKQRLSGQAETGFQENLNCREHEQSKCGEVCEEDSIVSLKAEREVQMHKEKNLKSLLHSLGTVTDSDDPFLDRKDDLCDEFLHRTLQDDVAHSRKRTTSISNLDTLRPAKVRRHEMSEGRIGGLNNTEDLYKARDSQILENKQGVDDCEEKRVLQKILIPNDHDCCSKSEVKLEYKAKNGLPAKMKTLLTKEDLLSAVHSACCISRALNIDELNSRTGCESIHCSSWRSDSFSDRSSRSRSRSLSPQPWSGSSRSDSDESGQSDEFCFRKRSTRSCTGSPSRSCCDHHRRSLSKHYRGCGCSERSGSSCSCSSLCSLSESYLPLFSRSSKPQSPDVTSAIKMLLTFPALPSSFTTLTVAPVTGTTGGAGVGSNPPGSAPGKGDTSCVSSSPAGKDSAACSSDQPEVNKKESSDLHDVPKLAAADKTKVGDKETSNSCTPAPASASTSVTPASSSAAASVGTPSVASTASHSSRSETGSSGHSLEPLVPSIEYTDDRFGHQNPGDFSGYDQYSHYQSGYHSSYDPYYPEDPSYGSFGYDGGEYDYYYDQGQNEYGYNNDVYHHQSSRLPGPNMNRGRRPPSQGYRSPSPRMFPPHNSRYGPPRSGMGPPHRMGLNGPIGSRGPRPQMGPGGPPRMRGAGRGPSHGPMGPMRPPGMFGSPGMRGPPGSGMMGPQGPGGPRPRIGPPRMNSSMSGQSSHPPRGPRPRMGPLLPGAPLREDPYQPPRSGIPPHAPGGTSYRPPMLNLSQPPPNFSMPPVPAALSGGGDSKISEKMGPPPLPPPKPPTPKPPPPPKKEEEKKEEIKPMTPLIPPEQVEQYRKLQEQAQKHAKKQLRKQQHQAKGEPESSDDEEEQAKKKEFEARLAAEQEEMERAALLAAQNAGELTVDDGATILMPSAQPTLIQQPAMVIAHHPGAAPQSPYGLMVSASHLMHGSHPALHPSHLQGPQIVASPAQPQLVQLPNGQMAYAAPCPVTYQAGAPVIAMPPQAVASMPQHLVLSSGGVQVPVAAHPGIAVPGTQYMTHMMAAQAQAAQMQAAQAQAAQMQAAQAAQLHGLVPGVHPFSQHIVPAMHPQGQIILVPRMTRPHI